MNSLLADARKVSRKVKKSNNQAAFEDFVNRIQKKILKIAATGQTSYRFNQVPNRREYLASSPEMFVKIAKHFSGLGFDVTYNKKEGSKVLPRYDFSAMTICWN